MKAPRLGLSWPLYKTFQLEFTVTYKLSTPGSGCGSVGRAVASDTRGQRFESSHW